MLASSFREEEDSLSAETLEFLPSSIMRLRRNFYASLSARSRGRRAQSSSMWNVRYAHNSNTRDGVTAVFVRLQATHVNLDLSSYKIKTSLSKCSGPNIRTKFDCHLSWKISAGLDK